jgi:hypothetical protein
MIVPVQPGWVQAMVVMSSLLWRDLPA